MIAIDVSEGPVHFLMHKAYSPTGSRVHLFHAVIMHYGWDAHAYLNGYFDVALVSAGTYRSQIMRSIQDV